MKTLQQYFEGLLDMDFDISEEDVIVNNLQVWLETARSKKFTEALADLLHIMEPIKEVTPMKRSNLAETNTVITIEGDAFGYANIVYRDKRSFFSHISLSWYGTAGGKASLSKGRHNLVEFANKRKRPNLYCWILPASAFDKLYDSAS